MSALFIVVPDFVEVIFIELPNKAGKVAMLEVFREDGLGEAFILDEPSEPVGAPSNKKAHLQHDKAFLIVTPSHDLRIRRIFQHP